MNPADLFTKLMESRVKVDQLIGLFGCEFREGCAAAAPKLRREGLKEFEGAELGGEEDIVGVAMSEAKMHDPDVLPHMYSEQDLKRFFPNIRAAPLTGFGEDDPAGLEPELLDPMVAPPGERVHRPHTIRQEES